MRAARPRRATLAVLGLLLVSGCSSPTAPSPPGTPPPSGNPSNPPALSISCPANQTSASATGSPVAVSFPAPVAAGGVAPVQVACVPPSGSAFPVGTTVIQCSATDSRQTQRACTFSVTVTAPPPRLSRSRIVAFGDSMTAGEIVLSSSAAGSPAGSTLAIIPSLSYPTHLAALLRARYVGQPIDVINAGAPGEWAEDGAKRLPAVISANRPDVLLLLDGSNELGALGQAGVNRAWVSMDLMAKEGRNRGARVFIASLPPPRPGGPKALPTSVVTMLNDRLRTTARGEGAVFVDLHAELLTDVTRFISSDGLHPTEAGYRRMAQAFFDAIRGDLEVR